MDTAIKRFKNACKNGDLNTVFELFDVLLKEDINMLKMRNIAVEHGNLNILEFLHKSGINITKFYLVENPLTIAVSHGWVDTESKPRWRGFDDAKFNHARVINFSVIIFFYKQK